jgi:GNAT superfamily N-acetyltransferase
MALPEGVSLAVEDDPAEADVEILPHALEAFNTERWPDHQGWQPLGVFLRDGGTVVAGLAGETYAGWLFVRYLWVSAALRGQGVGSHLLQAAEARAVARGCHAVWLDTFSFQAPEFYRRLGYAPFATLEWSPQHARIFLHKRLAPPA